jgi:hypothetical protein
MTAKQTTSNPARILAVILVLAPPVLLAVLLWRDSVNVPFWDQWDDDIAGLFVKFKTGQLAFADFWSQHNESRLVLPRIFILLLGCLTHWNVCCEMAITFLLACLIAWAIHRLERTAFDGQPKLSWPIFFISSLLIFSPAQSEAWLWGMEFILYLPLACVLLGLLTCQSKISGAAKWFACLLMALISTYTFSNGLVVWIVLFPALFFSIDDLSQRGKMRAMLWWMICFAGNSVLYFYNYQFPAANGFWQKIFTDPLPIARYFFAFEGGLLVNRDASHGLVIAQIVGLCLVIPFSAVCIYVFRRRNDSALVKAAVPWLTIGIFSIFSAGLATSGRAVQTGLEQALSPRYGIFGVCLIVAVIHLLPLGMLHATSAKNNFSRRNKIFYSALSALGLGIVLLYALALPSDIFDMEVNHLGRLQAKSCLDFIDVVPRQPAMTTLLYHTYPRLKDTADALDQLGVLNYSLLKTNRVSQFASNQTSGHQPCGRIEYSQSLSEKQLAISGWAVSAARQTPADCVLFSYEGVGIAPTIFGLMDERTLRPDLVAKSNQKKLFASGWQKICRLAELPKGALKLKAWAYDTGNRKIKMLEGSVQVDNK